MATYARQMKKKYTARMRGNNPFTWGELDAMNKDIHNRLDSLKTWTDNPQDNTDDVFHKKSYEVAMNHEVQPNNNTISSNRTTHGMDYGIEESKIYKNMKKNVKRINESQLRTIVAESIKKVLKEEVYRESPLYNEYGELIDTGGWYDDEDYYDPYDPDEYNASEKFADRIYDGEFDNKLHDEEWRDSVTYHYYDSEMGDDGGVNDAINNRLCVIDKNYAMKYGKNNKDYNPDIVWGQKEYPNDANYNIYDRSASTSKKDLGAEGFEDWNIDKGWFNAYKRRLKDEDPEEYNKWYKKNGNYIPVYLK